MMDINAYLERINYYGSLTPSIQTLQALQKAHLRTAPFENLSIHWDEPIVLEDDSLFDKVVNRRRGGFCYELNGLFSALLRALGFDVVMLSAKVARDRGEYTADFAHMTLMVTLEERWLVDVGFGDSFRLPLRIDDPNEQPQDGASYKITPDDEAYILWECKLGGQWQRQYRFRPTPYQYPDFLEMCHYQQYSPDSRFRQGRVCSMATADGRITLSEMKFITTWLDGRRREQPLENEAAFLDVLSKKFGIGA
ncbi:MAG: arylamine N-acetyltransferase [Candidatus Promineifilaceae bacterium]